MPKTNSKVNQIIEAIHAKIANRTYLPGSRLPSVRLQAKSMQVSVSTVVEAYGRLMATGVIMSKRGSGYYINTPIAPLSLNNLGPNLDRAVDPLWISRQSLTANDDMLKPGCGWLPESWMYEMGFRKALRQVSRCDVKPLVEYATPAGNLALRQLLVRRLSKLEINIEVDQIVLTESGTHAIDLLCRFFLEPGDTVLIDDPCYFNFQALLKAHRVNIVGIPYTKDGPDLEKFETALKLSPRLYITNSGIHNPTGARLSTVKAHQLLKLVSDTNLIIIEDDIFADFELNPAPRLAAFDNLSQVIQIGSFSKSISASLRCGYIATKAKWIEDLIDLKIATTFGGGHLASEVIVKILSDSGYQRYLESLRIRLAKKMQITIQKLSVLGITPYLVPEAGMFLWCQLPMDIDAARLAKDCLSEGIILAPGNVFSQSLNAHSMLRFNVAQCDDKRIFEVLKRLLSGYEAGY